MRFSILYFIFFGINNICLKNTKERRNSEENNVLEEFIEKKLIYPSWMKEVNKDYKNLYVSFLVRNDSKIEDDGKHTRKE